MATMNKPKLLLLDEHTAALDPKTALKVLTLSAKIVEENHLTTMMITHNMKDAIKYGNRLIMMHEGHIIYDVSGEEKKNLQVSDLLAKFQIASGGEFANDRMILSDKPHFKLLRKGAFAVDKKAFPLRQRLPTRGAVCEAD